MLPPKWQSVREHEVENRYKIWKDNVRAIWEHNQKKASWKAGLNMFSHLTDEEFRAIEWGFKPAKDNGTTNLNMPPVDHSVKRVIRCHQMTLLHD